MKLGEQNAFKMLDSASIETFNLFLLAHAFFNVLLCEELIGSTRHIDKELDAIHNVVDLCSCAKVDHSPINH